MASYIKGKGILVGTYSSKDVEEGIDRAEVRKAMLETGYQYTNQELIHKNGKVTGIKLYVCDARDMKI